MEVELLNKTNTKSIENTESKEKKNFDFVDTIRCISMMGIVFEHCAAVETGFYDSTIDAVIETSFIQSFKFSTIAFFLIGGFLINYKFQEYSALEYIKNRLKSTVKPWLFWIFVYIAVMVLDRYIAYTRGRDQVIVSDFLGYIWERFTFSLFYTPSWFILNFLICICILLIFKKHLYSWKLGLSLAILSLVYSLNIYHEWFVSNHSTALFGFVFYLWLGVVFNRYFDVVMSRIKRTSWFTMIFAVTVLFILSVFESFILMDIGVRDAYNTLRITNVVYSLVVFAALLKMGGLPFLQKHLEPRKTTFGIYLIHFVLIVRGLPLIFQPMGLNYESYSVWTNECIHLLRTVIVYGLSFLMTKLIIKTRYKWIVGN